MIGESKGGIPAPTTAADLLALDDATLGAMVVSSLSAKDPKAENFAALGRMVRAATYIELNGFALLDAVIRRGRRA